MAKRYEEQDKSFRVGPGSYSLRSEQDMVPKKKTSLGYRFEHKWAKTGAPGPAQYTINTEKKNFRKTHTFGHGYKDTIYRSDTVNNPPPTKYNKNYSCVQTEQSVSFTKGYREAYYLSDQTPGPNQYFQELESSFKKSGISFNSKHQKKETESGPGPGCYNPLRNNSTPTCRIGTQKKLVLKANKHPGPGSYDLNEKRKNYHKGSTFQKGLKKSFITFGENPGPADYIEEYSSLKGPKVKMVFK